jgi:exoribonuclease R
METNQQYRISVFDKKYQTYEYRCVNTNCVLSHADIDIDPTEKKLFSQDVFLVDSKGEMRILESPVRTAKYIAGVLVIADGRTYGRTKNQKRLLYKCIPDNNEYPVFLVPYEVKHGFSKSIQNRFVLFKYSEWEISAKHPHGILTEVLGDVGTTSVYYEYQVYCKNLFVSMREFSKQISNKMADTIDTRRMKRKYNVQDFSSDYAFTIDPPNTTDFDDAFSITKTSNKIYKISVHIANVAVVLEYLELWEHVTNRASTIYLPDHPRHMLPSSLSQNYCSLVQNTERCVMTMDAFVDVDIGKIRNFEFRNKSIVVKSNYVYEEESLLANESYKILFDVSHKLDESIRNSHDMVAYWMMKMNMICGDCLSKYRVGIYKTLAVKGERDIPQGFSETSSRVIKNWKNVSSNYESFNDNLSHALMDVTNYCHITSPIRRIVDIVNQILFLTHLGRREFGMQEKLSESADAFCQKWLYKIPYVNESMKETRKIQNNCTILDKIEREPQILQNEYSGVVFDKKNKYHNVFCYMVFIETLNMLFQLNNTQSLDEYHTYNFKLFIFECEDNIKRKVRLQLLE